MPIPVFRILLLGLLVVLAGCAGLAPFQPPAIGPADDSMSARLERASLEHVNAARRAEGLEPMHVDPLLSRIALAHARDMQARGYYGHTSPSGEGVQGRHDRAGGAQWRVVAENIARCSRCTKPPDTDDIRAYHARWMASAGHRANILRPGLDAFGFAAVHGADGFYLVQAFSGAGLPNDFKPGDSLAPLAPDAQAEMALEAVNAARARAGASPLAAAPELSAAIRRAMPSRDDPRFDLPGGAVHQSLNRQDRNRWAGVSTTYGACAGCGRAPVAADIRFFVREWLERPANRALLLDPAASHLGFAIAANGEGRKVALAAIGRSR